MAGILWSGAMWIAGLLYATHILVTGLPTIDAERGDITGSNTPGTPAAVLVAHPDCWTTNAPAGVIPGHVIWQHPDGRTVYSKALTGPALDTLFGDGDLAGRPVAFCR